MKMHKKGQVMDNLGALGIGIATLCIILVVAFMIMAQSKTNLIAGGSAQMCDNSSNTYYPGNDSCQILGVVTGHSTAWNASTTLTNATAQVPGWVPIIVITAIGSILIGMVMMFRR